MLLTIIGLCLFEIVSSLDNAVVNADILATMGKKWRRWFLTWGIFFSVFLVRGLLPFFLVWIANPTLNPIEVFSAAFSNDPAVAESMKQSAPLLLIAGGVFLIFLFFHWLFVEPKEFGFRVEKFFSKQAIWFYSVISIILCVILWFAIQKDPMLGFAAAIGSSAFFIIHGLKEQAARAEQDLKKNKDISDISKVIYLEILDATFSIDGVIGAFAFTMSVPLIILGNGLGAIVVRELTIKGVDHIKKFKYLKNGAMYSIFFLGFVMVAHSFGVHIPDWLSPVVTIGVIGVFFVKSIMHQKATAGQIG